MVKHFLSIEDYTTEELQQLLELTVELKKLYKGGESDNCLAGKCMVVLFEKPSSRTRISFQVAFAQLGGTGIYIRPEDIGGLGKREPIKDLMRVLNGYVDVIVARTFDHQSVVESARYAEVPVVNALTDRAHPCQAMADMITIQEHLGRLEGVKLAYIGDGNNVANSLAWACSRLGLNFVIAAPEGYNFGQEYQEKLQSHFKQGQLMITSDPYEAVQGAEVIYTDTWTSMGQEEEKEKRVKDFAGYQVDRKLVEAAKPGAKIMHCLPAYRGLEITDEVIESKASIVFEQAENRLHFQRALLKYLLCYDK